MKIRFKVKVSHLAPVPSGSPVAGTSLDHGKPGFVFTPSSLVQRLKHGGLAGVAEWGWTARGVGVVRDSERVALEAAWHLLSLEMLRHTQEV